MAKVGPYALLQLLSDSHIAQTWLAQSDDGQRLTVVVMTDGAKRNSAHRSTFSFAMVFINQVLSGQNLVAATDPSGKRPWIAFHGENHDAARQFLGAMNIPFAPDAGTGQPGRGWAPEPMSAELTVPQVFPAPPEPEQATILQPIPQEERRFLPPGAFPSSLTSPEPAAAQPGSEPTAVLGFPPDQGSTPPSGLPQVGQQPGVFAAPEPPTVPQQAGPGAGAPPVAGHPQAPAVGAPQPGQPGAAQPGPQQWPGQAQQAPGQFPGQPGPGQPAPGQPGPGQAWQGQAVTGHQWPGQPGPGQGGPVQPQPPQQWPGAPAQGMPVGAPQSAPPAQGWPTPPVSAAPYPVSGMPGSVSAAPYPVSGPAGQVSGTPYSAPPGQASGVPYTAAGYPPPKKSRKGLVLVLGALALVVVLLLGGGVVAYLELSKKPDPKPSPQAEPEPTTGVVPGLEPPQVAVWPNYWAVYKPTDKTVPSNTKAEVGFDFKVPTTWTCAKQQVKPGWPTMFQCGDGSGAAGAPSGQLVVRDCPDGCGEDRQKELRRKENAWGLQWFKAEDGTLYARDKEGVEDGGQKQYRLVVVRYARSKPGGPLDRQVTLRLTSSTELGWHLQRVANELRTAVA
ncbi:hypothetical protein [Longispora urticae]